MNNVDIKFIAEKSGCSIATVSRVINRSKPVSKEMEKRVMDMIKKYNYNPNAHARYLAEKKTRLLGFIMTNHINQYQLLLFRYLNEFACVQGYGCIIRYCNSSFQEKLEVLQELEIRGIEVCFTLFLLTKEEEKYINEHFRIRVCHMQSLEMKLNLIEKNQKSVYEAVVYLSKLGHKKIGGIFYQDDVTDSFIVARENGFLRAMEQTNLLIDPAYIGHLKGEVDSESVVSVIEKIFVPNHFPTAIFCYSDEVAIELMCWLMRHGYKIPEDVSVLSFDGIPFTERLVPSITTICQPVEFQAERIINGMLYLLNGEERKSGDTGNDYVLQIRNSTGVPRE